VSTPGKPDLDRLITALTADSRPDELAGRDAALAAFRAAGQPARAGQAAGRRRRVPFRRPFTALPGRLAALTVAGITAVAGLTAAAYAQALPGPVQQAAHTVFAPLGVPESQQQSGQPGHPAAETIATSGAKSGQAGDASSRTPSPRPGGDYLLTLTASRVRVPAGAVVELGGRVTDRGRAAAGVPVRLFERLAGSATWEPVGAGVTGPRGGFRLLSPPLTTTAVFRVVAGPGNAHSAAVRVTVVRANVTTHPADDAPGPAATAP
jgi:hypothetical protein